MVEDQIRDRSTKELKPLPYIPLASEIKDKCEYRFSASVPCPRSASKFVMKSVTSPAVFHTE